MIIQPTHEQTRRVTRSRTYSGPGFGPRSFECLGMGMGLGMQFSFGASGAPNPLSIFGAANVKLWLRADLGVSGLGTAGAAWADQSGNGWAPFVQATVANQAVLALDATINQLAFTFDGTNDGWSSPTPFPSQASTPYAMIVIAKIPSYAVASQPLLAGDSYQPGLATRAGASIGMQAGAAGPLTAGQTTWKRIIAEWTSSASDRIQQGSVSVTGPGTSGALTSTNSYIGGSASLAAYLACSVAEVIVVRPIPVSYTAIDAYLSARYGAGVLA